MILLLCPECSPHASLGIPKAAYDANSMFKNVDLFPPLLCTLYEYFGVVVSGVHFQDHVVVPRVFPPCIPWVPTAAYDVNSMFKYVDLFSTYLASCTNILVL